MKLIDDLYVYEWNNPFENNCNSYYIAGGVNALIDPGLSEFLPDLLVRLEGDGVTRDDIEYVINTHSHPDHFEASEIFASEGKSTICMLREEIDFYNEMGREMFDLFGFPAPDVPIDRVLEAGPVEFGGEPFEIIHVPGHSPGSLALYWPARKALFCGDVVFNQNVGRTDFPGGNPQLLKDSIQRLSRLDVDYLLPGHLNIIQGKEAIKRNFEIISEHILVYL